jgi:hypothetical protein
VTGVSNVPAYYPGPNYVDYIGLDGYARGAAQTLPSVFAPGLARIRTLPGAAALPMLIGETGVLNGIPARDEWLSNGYRVLYQRFRQLAGIVYFDFNMTDVFGQRLESGNWQIEEDPAALIAYAALANDPRFQGTLSEPSPIAVPSPSLPSPSFPTVPATSRPAGSPLPSANP